MSRRAAKGAPRSADDEPSLGSIGTRLGKAGIYGVLVSDNSMAEEYNKNDIAFIDPSINPKKDDACLFRSERPDGTEEGLMAYLDRAPDASELVYYVSQT